MIQWCYGYFVYFFEIVLFLVVAYAVGFTAIANHDFMFILILMLLWAAQMVSYTMFMSTIFGNKWAALVFNFFLLIFVSGNGAFSQLTPVSKPINESISESINESINDVF